jgi:hypothetical protein
MSTTTLTALYDTRAEARPRRDPLASEAGVARSTVSRDRQETGPAPSGGHVGCRLARVLKCLFVQDDDRAGPLGRAVGALRLPAHRAGARPARPRDGHLEEHGAVDLDRAP